MKMLAFKETSRAKSVAVDKTVWVSPLYRGRQVVYVVGFAITVWVSPLHLIGDGRLFTSWTLRSFARNTPLYTGCLYHV